MHNSVRMPLMSIANFCMPASEDLAEINLPKLRSQITRSFIPQGKKGWEQDQSQSDQEAQ
jgi:hypothetical protein